MSKFKKLLFALILSIILIVTGSTANINLVLADDDDSFFDFKNYNHFYKSTNGLTGEYYNNMEFKGFKVTRIDSRISFDWGLGPAGWRMNPDKFSIRWTGQILPAYSEEYTFHTITDDGVRLWINNHLIIDEWNNNAATEYEGTIKLAANKKYNIRMEYYENKNDACAKLLWSSKKQPKEIIPENRLFPLIGSVINPSPSVAPIPLDLEDYFNQDAFSYDSKRSDGDYDGSDNTYSADLANKDQEYDNTPFKLGSFANGRDNSIICDGQTIGISKDKYSSIQLAGSATNGDKTGEFKVNYTDGTYSSFSITMKDWCTNDTSDDHILQKMDHRHTVKKDNTTNCSIFVYYLTTDRNKTAKSITLPDLNNMHILAATLVPYGTADQITGKGNGLRAEYFDDMDLTDSGLVRTDSIVNFDWGTGSPNPGIGPNTFSARWTGEVLPQFSESYTFYTVSDDGVRLWVNNKLIIDDWTEHAATEKSGSISLKAGQKYNIKLEYYDRTDKASIKLSWSSHSRPKQIIPESQLYH